LGIIGPNLQPNKALKENGPIKFEREYIVVISPFRWHSDNFTETYQNIMVLVELIVTRVLLF